jgi:hypothetical protein
VGQEIAPTAKVAVHEWDEADRFRLRSVVKPARVA